MTARQQQIVAIIRAFIGANGFPPTVREIAERTHLAPSTVQHHLGKLRSKGVLRRGVGTVRSVALTDPATCPNCGRGAA